MIITPEMARRIQERPQRPPPKILTPKEEVNLLTLWLEGQSPASLARAQGMGKARMYKIIARWREAATQVLAK